MSLIFEDLPASPADRVDWGAIGAELKTHPFKWARIGTYPKQTTAASIAYQINRGKKHSRLTEYGRFEAKSRTIEGEFRVYARWIGPWLEET